MATYDGLVRFDGTRFSIFDSGNTPALPSNRILHLFVTGDGSLWIHTENGHLVLYRDGTFTRYSPDDHFDGAPIVSGYNDAAGTLWVGTSTGAYRFNENRFERFAPAVLHDHPVVFYEAHDGAFWIGTEASGAFRFEAERLTTRTLPAERSAQHVSAFWEEDATTLWFRTDQGVGAYSEGQVRPRVVPAGAWIDSLEVRLKTPVQRFQQASGDRFLYVPDQSGLYGFLTQNQSLNYEVVRGPEGHEWFLFEDTLYRDGTAVFVADGQLSASTFDFEGNLWLASAVGLYQLNQAPFSNVGAAEGATNIYGVLESRDGAIWAASLDVGIIRYQDGKVTSFHDPEDRLLALSLHEDPDGRIWVGYWGGICSIDPGADAGCRDVEVPGLSGDVPVRGILRYEEDLWIGTGQGLYRLTHDHGTWQHYTTADGLSHNHVRVFLRDRHGALWIGTFDGGVTRYQDGTFTTLTEAGGLSSNIIRALYQDANGTLWVGTENRGLNRVVLDVETGLPQQITPIRRSDGLFDDGIHQILEDAQRRFWMSTNRGIFRVPRADLDAFAEERRARVFATAYNERNGMADREANGGVHNAGIRARDGRLWFPTQAGLAVVDPATVSDRTVPPPVVIESAHYADTTVVRPATLRLPVGVRRLEAAYTALAFRNPQAVEFRYRLAGLEAAWVMAGQARTATYTNIPPGDYRFEVVASSALGIWNTESASFVVHVSPYFYETRWFALVGGLLVLFVVAGAYRWRVRQLQRRKEMLERIVKERTHELEHQKGQLAQQAEQLHELDRAKSRFFANISHEFRTPLTLSMGPLQDLQRTLLPNQWPEAQAQLEQALLNNRRLLRLVNQLLDVARLEGNSLRLSVCPIPLQPYLHTLCQAFVGLAERRKLTFRHRFATEPILLYADPDQLEKIVTNLLSNAFKYTPEGETIELAAHATEERITLTVRDTGVGISPERVPHIFDRFYQASTDPHVRQAGTGIGLSLAKELVALHGGTISVTSEVGKGTRFDVTLPAGRAHFADRPEVQLQEEVLNISHYVRETLLSPEAAPTRTHGTDEEADDQTTVLVVDDNAEIRAYVSRHLNAQYRVLEAADGAEALTLARQAPPDLIVSDVMMPRLDGFGLIEALREDPELDFVPVILLTARAEQSDRLAGLHRGADDYLTKPFDVQELLVRIRNLIAVRHRLRQELQQAQETPPLQAQSNHASQEPTSIDLIPEDRAFLARMHETVAAHLSDENFGVDTLAEALGTSRATLYRRVRAAQGETPAEYLRNARLERAKELLKARVGNVSEVAYAVGFRSVPHFTRCFREHTGQTPAVYAAHRSEA